MLSNPFDRHELVSHDVEQVVCSICDTEQPVCLFLVLILIYERKKRRSLLGSDFVQCLWRGEKMVGRYGFVEARRKVGFEGGGDFGSRRSKKKKKIWSKKKKIWSIFVMVPFFFFFPFSK
ncbi:hypothetical protein RchiOBHm_Chr3g0497511 [Rosa chinensis]|uniref:Uncharacterized protein n=1 Tax=Rosa chinensis TaxID=74649 RepID=A0A2P6RHQ7_ROSCH|nr:hypothetical protein RchiOBHm_Chr3g0497511 [Rosa chinensis]